MIINSITVEGDKESYPLNYETCIQTIIEITVMSKEEYNLLTWLPIKCSVWLEDNNLAMSLFKLDKFLDFSKLFDSLE